MSNVYYYKRTQFGSFNGSLKQYSSSALGTELLRSIVAENSSLTNKIEHVILGSVLQAGQGQNIARQILINSGLSNNIPAMTINKVCSSGIYSLCLAHDLIKLDRHKLILSGGVESMTNSPLLAKNFRDKIKQNDQINITPAELTDSVISDGLWDNYYNLHMGTLAEELSTERGISRQEQDAFAKKSYEKAMAAYDTDIYNSSILKIADLNNTLGATTFLDEELNRVKFEKFSTLKTPFKENGTITAANASSINDGAAMLLLGDNDLEDQFKPLARIIDYQVYATDPKYFTTAPVEGTKLLLSKYNLKISDIDLFEVNEAFSVVGINYQRELQIAEEKMNIFGGAVAIGHPIGASGARIVGNLILGLKAKKLKLGIASICNGGGESTTVLIENNTL